MLAALLEGRALTHLDVWHEMASSRAAHHVHVLRRGGWPIRTDMRPVSTRDGRREDIAYYTLSPDAIAEAGERGRRYVEAAMRGRP